MKSVLKTSLILALFVLSPEISRASLVIRTGQPRCWAKWQFQNDWICAPREIWVKTFQTHIRGGGHWTVSSPLENEGDPKVQLRTFHLSQSQVEQSETSGPSNLQASFQFSVEAFREHLSQALTENFQDSYGILSHLLLSEAKSDDHTAFFRDLGFIHLFSASGIHLYALSFLCGFLFLGLGRLLQFPVVPCLIGSRFATTAIWIWGWLLAGLRLGMLRPLLLIFIQRIAKIQGFRWRKWTPLCLALSFDVLLSAITLFSKGLPLSNFNWSEGRAFYLLAIGGGALLDHDERQHHLSLSIASWLLDAIWDATSWGMITCMTPLLSLITIPLITLLIYPALVVFSLAEFFSIKSSVLLSLLSTLFQLLEKFMTLIFRLSLHTGNLWIVSPITVFAVICLATLIFLIPSRHRFYVLGLAASVLAISRISMLSESHAAPKLLQADEVTQLDVGQGDSALVVSRSGAGLIDTGSIHALSDSAWIRIFASRGLNRVQWIGLTHLDEDHSGGALRLARLMPIDCLTTSEAELQSARGKVYEGKLQQMGTRVDHQLSSCVPYPAREPTKEQPGAHTANENMSAFLIPLRGSGFYLSAGDATEADELKIADWVLNQGAAKGTPRILKISHHGSKTSTSQEWLNKIGPTEAWISVGIGNRYGHPTLRTLDLIQSNGIPIRRTDISGALSTRRGYSPKIQGIN
jgi:competence protein ComEC